MRIFTVSEFIEHINNIFVEEEMIIEGEVTDFKISQGKWVFFDLKDKNAKIGCFLTVFQMRGAPIEDGMKIRIFGYPKIHPKSGRFSVIVRHIELAGEGALKRAFEMVKVKLEREGLFALERKRLLPRFPKIIGLITSRESAAYSDFIKILNSRWGGVKIYLANVPVQGKEAVFSITSAFDYFNHNYLNLRVEEIVLVRGGGSLEDLAAFNSEEVARAVFSSKAPVVCGVGHERDFSIADLTADVRASTPSAAAQIVAPSREEINIVTRNNLKVIEFYLNKSLKDAERDLSALIDRFYKYADAEIENIEALLRKLPPLALEFHNEICRRRNDIVQKVHALYGIIDYANESFKARVGHKVKLLESLNPEKVLARGYSMVFKRGKLIKSAKDIRQGEEIDVKLYKGEFRAEVLNVGKLIK